MILVFEMSSQIYQFILFKHSADKDSIFQKEMESLNLHELTYSFASFGRYGFHLFSKDGILKLTRNLSLIF